MRPLRESPFSFHFNNLVYLGAWALESKDPRKVGGYAFYKLLVFVAEVYGLIGLSSNLILVFGDLKKMSWNLCVTVLLVGSSVKVLRLFHRNRILNDLRAKLHRDAEARKTPEDVSIQESALRELRAMQAIFYATMVVFVPTWIATRYFVHKELPIPLPVPEPLDLEDELQFNFLFVVVSFAAIFGLTLAVEGELAMFAVLIQISREYAVLLKDIPKVNELYDAPHVSGRGDRGQEGSLEVNPWLRNAKTKALVKQFCSRLQELIEYTEAFELCYSVAFFEELFGTSLIIITLAVQSLLGSLDLSGDFFYQIGYLYIVVVDMFSICMYASRLQTQCLEVGLAAYSTQWYRMGTDVQRDVLMIIMRSQHPPKITAAKLMQLNLAVFLQRMGNIYSCVALLRQLEFKFVQPGQ